MKTSALRSHIHLPMQSNLNRPTPEPTPHLLPFKTRPRRCLIISCFPEESSSRDRNKPLVSLSFKPNVIPAESQKRTTGFQRSVILGAASLGLAVLLAGMDDGKALALGPEGPLMEEFWDNMRRYGLYIVTVSTGVIYTVFQPILELLKNPITAVLIIIILGGSIYIVSQVLSAMVGTSNFAYEYGY